jgi:hypothetical protein
MLVQAPSPLSGTFGRGKFQQMRAKLRLFTALAFALFLVVGVSGCQFSYPFEFSGVVRTADGAPLPGVTVILNAGSVRESSFPVVSGADGTFKARVLIGDIAFMREALPKWSLELSKVGYESAAVDVSPQQKPESPRKTTFISTEGTLKAK